jgi:cobalamin synthase
MPGAHEITATADGMAPSSQPVRFAWPWIFLSAAVAGILLAGWARRSDNRRQSFGRAVAKGAPFGLIAAIAAAIGIDRVGLKLAGQPLSWAAVAVIAVFGAWAGRKVFELRA